MSILTSVTFTKVIESLEKIFCTMGYRSRWKHFNGTQFVSDEFERFLKKNDIEHCTSTPLWPQANREVERQNRSLLKALRSAKAEKKTIWTEMRKVLTAYRRTPHSSTGVTPAKLLFNRSEKSDHEGSWAGKLEILRQWGKRQGCREWSRRGPTMLTKRGELEIVTYNLMI